MEQEKAPETSTFAELQAVSTRSEHLGLREGGQRVAGGHRSPHLLLPGPGPTLLLTWPPPPSCSFTVNLRTSAQCFPDFHQIPKPEEEVRGTPDL